MRTIYTRFYNGSVSNKNYCDYLDEDFERLAINNGEFSWILYLKDKLLDKHADEQKAIKFIATGDWLT